MGELRTQWHPAFCSAVELILKQDREYLEFIREYNLNTKPLEIDLLVIKKPAGYEVKDEIGKIFREHNIFEYKSPDDEMNIDTFYKVNAYASLYKASGKTVDGIKSGSLSVSFIREGKPKKLLNSLGKEGFMVTNPYKGIYYVTGKVHFATQIVVSKELSGAQYVWLQALTRKLDGQTAERLVIQAQSCDTYDGKELVDSVLTVSAKANREVFGRMKEDAKMYEVLKELMVDEFNDVEANARQEESQEGLKALIDILKGMLPDFDSVYQRIIKNDKYANVSREQAMQYWQ